MSRTTSLAFRQSVNAQETSQAFITLLIVSSENLTESIYIADDAYEILPIAGVRGVVSGGQEYVYIPFLITLPSEDETGVGRASITIDNVSRQVVEAVRTAKGAIDVRVKVVLASNPDSVEVDMKFFKLSRISYDAMTISADVEVQAYDREPFPKIRFTPSLFPGLF